MKLDLAVAELADIGQAVEIEIGEEKQADSAQEEDCGSDPFQSVGSFGKQGVGEKRTGKREREPAGDVVHQFGIAQVFIGLAGCQDVEIVEGEDVIGARRRRRPRRTRRPVFRRSIR